MNIRSKTVGLDITGHRDGYALWFADRTVDVFPTLAGASQAYHAAQWATSELSRFFPGAERTQK